MIGDVEVPIAMVDVVMSGERGWKIVARTRQFIVEMEGIAGESEIIDKQGFSRYVA